MTGVNWHVGACVWAYRWEGVGTLLSLSFMGQIEPPQDNPSLYRLHLWHVLSSPYVTLGSCACKVSVGTNRLGNWKKRDPSGGEADRTHQWGSYTLGERMHLFSLYLCVVVSICVKMLWLATLWKERSMNLIWHQQWPICKMCRTTMLISRELPHCSSSWDSSTGLQACLDYSQLRLSSMTGNVSIGST